MIEVKRVLFPTDFSECAAEAKDYACDLANRYGAEMHVIHAVHNASLEVPDFGMGLAFPGYVENLPHQRKELADAALAALHKLDFSELTSQNVKYEVDFGQPFLCVLDYADKHDIDLIVLGTHGRTGLSHVLLGSVAERIIQRAKCPVMTVRPAKMAQKA